MRRVYIDTDICRRLRCENIQWFADGESNAYWLCTLKCIEIMHTGCRIDPVNISQDHSYTCLECSKVRRTIPKGCDNRLEMTMALEPK